MSTQQITSHEDITQKEPARTNSQPGPKRPTLAALAFLILVALGGMVLLCYRLENPGPVPTVQGR